MKVSEFLRQYQLGNGVPDTHGDPEVAMWAGWLFAAAGGIHKPNTGERLEMACQAAEYIEKKAREST